MARARDIEVNVDTLLGCSDDAKSLNFYDIYYNVSK